LAYARSGKGWAVTYDDWKLATPPEYEIPDTCPACGEQEGFEGDYCACGWSVDGDEPEPPIGDDE